MNAKITITGAPTTKKNSSKLMWYRMVGGNKIPLNKPIKHWSKAYTEWGRKAVQQLIVYKSNYEIENGEKFQLVSTPHFVTFIFYVKDSRIRDISNFLEAPQDVMAGNLGFSISKKIKDEDYQILSDDNHKIITNLGGSRILIDPTNPRTEIYISPFVGESWKTIMETCHPDLEYSHLFSPQTKSTGQLTLKLGDLL